MKARRDIEVTVSSWVSRENPIEILTLIRGTPCTDKALIRDCLQGDTLHHSPYGIILTPGEQQYEWECTTDGCGAM